MLTVPVPLLEHALVVEVVALLNDRTAALVWDADTRAFWPAAKPRVPLTVLYLHQFKQAHWQV
jgi:hypothetical protein